MKATIRSLAAILAMALLTTVCPAQQVVPAGKARDGGKTKDDVSPKQPNIIICFHRGHYYMRGITIRDFTLTPLD